MTATYRAVMEDGDSSGANREELQTDVIVQATAKRLHRLGRKLHVDGGMSWEQITP